MANHLIWNVLLRISCAAIAIFNFASLCGVEFSLFIQRIGNTLTTVFLLALCIAVFGNKLLWPPRGNVK